ncbi:MAG: M23 family metallopeptidase [Gammaproteobacteria bacterium]|nr:M23 family metallopeptidase [Gammaproteobacteria bacterium]NNF60676.1 M23 family metallopeptidase [Gammaproteobacteria bacterium]
MAARILLKTAIFIALALPATVLADYCSLDWVCLRPTDHDDGRADFLVENLREYPVTVSVRVRSRNLRADGPNPVTVTVPANDSVVAMRMQKVLPHRDTWYRYNFDWTVGDQDAVHDDSVVYRLPYPHGKRFGILQGYGSRFSHTGLEYYTVDFNMPEGSPVHAARGGVVARVVEEHDIGCWEDGCGKYANFIVVLHDDSTTGEYYHLKKDGALVEPGERVKAGQLIGLSGNTGHTTLPHLHFGVYRAASWGSTQSIPVRFQTTGGIVTNPRRGRGYLAK